MIPSPPRIDPGLGLGASLMFVVLSALRRDAARRGAAEAGPSLRGA
ncbi:hypothetical protein [Methylobacterium sp. Leaf88]|nr:hypothetical protein [Methylobacterium sp. Leaf88]